MSEAINFKNLDEMIHSCVNEIVLESDVIFEDGKDYLDGIELDVDNIVIDGNNHIIDGGDCARIFTVSGKNIIIKNAVLKNANAEGYGGAITNLEGSELKIINVEFVNNTSFYGGAIFNDGEIEIGDVSFRDNRAKSGGAIANGSKMTMKNTEFDNNTADNAGVIDNWDSLEIKDSAFRKNSAEKGGAIINDAKLNLDGVIFENNSSNSTSAVYNQENGNLKIKNSKFKSNTSKSNGTIFNEGNFTISDSTFIDNRMFDESGSIFNSENSKFNAKHVTYANENPLKKDKIRYTPKYIQELIESGIKEISLNSSIEFNQTLKIDVDNVMIDGNNHYSEADIWKPLIEISSKNVLLKNFILNGLGKSGGIRANESSVKISNVKFIGFNLAIENYCGDLKIRNSSFIDNAFEMGGAIYNYEGNIEIINTTFKGNVGMRKEKIGATYNGGAIKNDGGEISIKSSEFLENGKGCRCTISNMGILRISDSLFENNFGKYIIFNNDASDIKNTVFRGPHDRAIGPYLYDVKVSNCAFDCYSGKLEYHSYKH